MRIQFFLLTFLAFVGVAQAETYSGEVDSATSYFVTYKPWKQCEVQILKDSASEDLKKDELKIRLTLARTLESGQPLIETEQLTLTPEGAMLGYRLKGYDYGFQTKPVFVEDQQIVYHYLINFKGDGIAKFMILRAKNIPHSFYGSTATLECPMVLTQQ